jgi:tetratricopeptide (TPR) repeat protein
MADTHFDIFICHASEDKARFVLPLYVELQQRGLNCWIDYHEIRLGDDFRRRMDEGLTRSRFGVVILSPDFFKYWPQTELSALLNQEATFNQKRIVPVRCDIDRTTVTQRLPLLAARVEVSWELGVAAVADRIRDEVRNEANPIAGRRSQVYNLPIRRAQKLFGRDPDIENLMYRLQPGKAIRIAASIEGLAGVGKTELALHLIDRLAEAGRFPGGIFWFDAENPDLTHAWGSVVADGLAVGPGEITNRAAAAVRLVSSGPPALIVLDNVETWTRSSEPQPLPQGTHVGLLATTRRQFFAGTTFEHYPLEFLPDEASRELLFAVAGRDLSRLDGTDRLLAYLGGHSLALELAGAYLREFSPLTPQGYLDQLQVGEDPGELVKDLVRYEDTLWRALDVQLARLDERAHHSLRVAACFAPEDASLSLLEACGVAPESQQSLRRLHLITVRENRWRMHRLVREWAQRTGRGDEQAQARRNFVEGSVDYAQRIELATGYQVYRDDGVHLELAMDQAESVLGVEDSRLSLLYDRIGVALLSLGSFGRARELLEQALAAALKQLGEDHPSVATSRSNLALVLKAQGELPRARELLEQALAADLKQLGEDHPSVATSRSNLALVLKDLGELPRARELLEQALAAALKQLGEDHPSVATRRSNLALVLQALGELPRARELLEQALAGALKQLGEDHPSVATRRSNLALVLQDLGELLRARELLEQALAAALKQLGEDHPSVARSRSNLALVLQDLGELPRARELLEQALAADLKQLGEDHPAVATSRANLAVVLKAQGELPRARELLEQALAADLKQLGEDHPAVATRRFNLATIMEGASDYDGAARMFAQALETEERILGPAHPSTSYTRVRLAECLAQLDRVEEARSQAQQALTAVSIQPAGSTYRVQVEGAARRILDPQ